MSTAATAHTTWEDFLLLPDLIDGEHYELHDGEVTTMPPPRPIHLQIQLRLVKFLNTVAKESGTAISEYPYRPAKNLQFWYADVAFIPAADEAALEADEYPVYSPPLIIEVLSPSNLSKDLARQRLAAFSAGTREFWIVDPDRQTIEVFAPGALPRVFTRAGQVPLSVLPGTLFPLTALFR